MEVLVFEICDGWDVCNCVLTVFVQCVCWMRCRDIVVFIIPFLWNYCSRKQGKCSLYWSW